jgi:hypothetical protein
MSENGPTASEGARDEQEKDSVLDFLYHDARRVGSFLVAQCAALIAACGLSSSCAGLTRLRGRSRFGEAKARASIHLRENLSEG